MIGWAVLLGMAAALGAAADDGMTCEQWTARGNEWAALGEPRSALACYVAAFGAAGESFESQLAALCLRALAHERLGEWATAEAVYRRITEAYDAAHGASPWVRRAWLGRGRAHARAEEWQTAEAALRRVAETPSGDSTRLEGILALAGVLADARNPGADFEQAARLYGAVLQAEPQRAEAAFGLAECYRAMGAHEEARRAYERAAAADPHGLWGGAAQAMAAALDEQRGDTARARERYTQLKAHRVRGLGALGVLAERRLSALERGARSVVMPPAEPVAPPPVAADGWRVQAAAMRQEAGVSIFHGPVRVDAGAVVIGCDSATLRADSSLLTCRGRVRVESGAAGWPLPVEELTLRVPPAGIAAEVGVP